MISLRRSHSPPFVDEPLTWKPVRKPDGSYTATLVCPNGHSGLVDDHRILPGGTVQPSVVCNGYPAGFRSKDAPAEPCTFHDFVKLEGWTGEGFGRLTTKG